MMINTGLQKEIYKIMCDTSIFEIGESYNFEQIGSIIYNIFTSSNKYCDITKDKLYHNVSQVLQTRNNSARNTNRKDYVSNDNIIRDISSVRVSNKGSNGRCLYTFGCLYKKGENII